MLKLKGQLRQLCETIGIGTDWHNASANGITAKFTPGPLDNAMGDESEATLEIHKGDTLQAKINLATLLAWATGQRQPQPEITVGWNNGGEGKDSQDIPIAILNTTFRELIKIFNVGSGSLRHGSLYADYASWVIYYPGPTLRDLNKIYKIVDEHIGRYGWWKFDCKADAEHNMIHCTLYRRPKLSTDNARME